MIKLKFAFDVFQHNNQQPTTPLGHISKHVQIVHHHEHSFHAYIFKMKGCKNWWQISFWRIKFWDSSDSSSWAWKPNESMKTEYLHFWEWKHTIVQILDEHIIENSSFLHEEDITQWQNFWKSRWFLHDENFYSGSAAASF